MLSWQNLFMSFWFLIPEIWKLNALALLYSTVVKKNHVSQKLIWHNELSEMRRVYPIIYNYVISRWNIFMTIFFLGCGSFYSKADSQWAVITGLINLTALVTNAFDIWICPSKQSQSWSWHYLIWMSYSFCS